MSTQLVPFTQSAVVLHAENVKTYLDSARSRNTIRGYRSGFAQFRDWCARANLCPLPASEATIAMYLSAEAGRLKAATLAHRLAAISKAHKTAGHPSPIKDNVLISETLKGIKRVHGSAQVQKAPVMTEDLRTMLRAIPPTLQGIRDRAVLLVGFSGAFRRSELVSFDVSAVAFTSEGMLITLLRSKTDQEGQGRQVAIPEGQHQETCPVRALRTWLTAAIITEGPIFRSVNRHSQPSKERLTDHSVGLIVKRYAKLIGLAHADFSGHSLRAGFVTSAARAGEPERRIMRQTGHKSIEMVLRYVRRADIFKDNSVRSLGL